MISKRLASISLFLIVTSVSFLLFQVEIASFDPRAQDPGVRKGSPGAGGQLAGLVNLEPEFFRVGKEDFEEAEEVDEGLGPRMNLDGCGGCHSQPSIGGSSPAVNPQVAFARAGRDSVPSFITADGPVREARFIQNPDGSADGGVHALFTINGRPGATSRCTITQPNFEREVENHNIIFRIPTPLFGAGLIEQIPDSAIVANQRSNAPTKAVFGIRGRTNIQITGLSGQTNNNGNDGTIARFGWKAQNKSLLLFSGEAYNVEMGITNELFQTEREENANCQYASVPNSVTDASATTVTEAITAIEKFSLFMRFLAPPTPSADTPGGSRSIGNGKNLFITTGCALCHTPTYYTGNSAVAALRYKPVNLFSDLLTHDVGTGLSDGVTQGEAGPREFRTAPLWGLGQRIFFLHDGRTSDLIAAIRAHSSSGSEANATIGAYNNLSEAQKQDLLNFLRSL